MSESLAIRNHQRSVPIDTRYLHQITCVLLNDLLQLRKFDLAIHIVRSAEIARLNETFLRHQGPTDVITFDYTMSCGEIIEPKLGTQNSRRATSLNGEIFVCIDEAVSQRKRFRTTWQSELARYVIHGVLHLAGYDDTTPSARRIMKRAEDRLLKAMGRRFRLSKLARAPKLAA